MGQKSVLSSSISGISAFLAVNKEDQTKRHNSIWKIQGDWGNLSQCLFRPADYCKLIFSLSNPIYEAFLREQIQTDVKSPPHLNAQHRFHFFSNYILCLIFPLQIFTATFTPYKGKGLGNRSDPFSYSDADFTVIVI